MNGVCRSISKASTWRRLFSAADGNEIERLGSTTLAVDSMIEAAICDGDWVVVRQQQHAENGDVVAAMLDGEATVKTFKRSDGHVWLMPHNPAYTPILGDDAKILGKVVAVLRRV